MEVGGGDGSHRLPERLSAEGDLDEINRVLVVVVCCAGDVC